MQVEVVVPYRPDFGHRTAIWEWIRPQYEWPVRTCDEATRAWVKGKALRAGLLRSSAEIVIVADADCVTEGLRAAVRAVEDGEPWAVPHAPVYRLTEASTAEYMAGQSFEDLDLEQRPYRGVWGGGFVVARRELLLEIPIDPRFVGWGQEDESWGVALQVLGGHPWRGKAPLVHLWHPPQDRLTRRWGSEAGAQLGRRYEAARANRRAMEQLIREAHEHFDADQPSLPAGAGL